ncbi:MAG: iron ABC transporter permease [Pseudomonadota bacterium]|nr:iron ABC transporter permease [Pseudomonadota bacterium]
MSHSSHKFQGVILLASILLSMQCGSSSFDLLALVRELWSFLTCVDCADKTLATIILFELRMPRTILAAMCGGALAAAGVISQGLFRNALASPSILGTSAGGGLFAVLAFYLLPVVSHQFTLPLSAFAGALLASVLVLSCARSVSIERLLLVGFALNTFFAAVTSLYVYLALEEFHKVSAIMNWLLGGFAGRSWQHIQFMLLPLSIGLILAYRIGTRLDILSLGEEVASSMNVDTRKLRYQAVLSIALLVGASVAVAGALPFIGLMIPHLARMWHGANHRNLLIKSFLYGSSFVLVIDSFTREVASTHELNVGIVTAMIGGVFFLAMLVFKRPDTV